MFLLRIWDGGGGRRERIGAGGGGNLGSQYWIMHVHDLRKVWKLTRWCRKGQSKEMTQHLKELVFSDMAEKKEKKKKKREREKSLKNPSIEKNKNKQ